MSSAAMHGADHALTGLPLEAARRRAGRVRPVVLAVFVASTMTACGMGLWQEPSSGHGAATAPSDDGDTPPRPDPIPAGTFPIEPVDAERKARKIRASAAVSARKAQRAKSAAAPAEDPALAEPQIEPPQGSETPLEEAAPAAEWIDPLATEEVATPDLAPSLPPGGEAGANPVAWIVVASCSLLGAFILWRRRRARQRRRRREAWTPIRWGGPKLIRPHWDYDPGRFDSDEFLQRWDSIGLSISGDWNLMLAIAGRLPSEASPFASWRRAVSRSRPLFTIRPEWRYLPFAGDAPEHLGRWCRLGLSIHGDPLLAAVAHGQFEWAFDVGVARAGLPVVSTASSEAPMLEEPLHEVEPDLSSELEVSICEEPVEAEPIEAIASPCELVVAPAEGPVAARDDANELPAQLSAPVAVIDAPVAPEPVEIAVEASASSTAEASTSAAPDIAATPPEETGGTAWISRIAPLLQAWDNGRAPETEMALWDMSRRLSAHAEALPPVARTPWLDAVEALAERMARSAPALSRAAWQAHWVDLRLARLGAMNGAWRLLELRALHDACAHDEAPEVIEARIRLLNVWAGALLGPAAKAKRAEAMALAASLRPAQAASA